MSIYDNQTGRLPPRSLLRNQYVIIGQAGKGGMGAVYHAIDRQNPNRHYAIKEMSQGHLSEIELREAIKQFQREADMLHRLSHPNLPHIYDYFEENGRTYLVMDFINGKTLFQMLKESGDRPLPVLQVLDYANQLCDVLTYLHQQIPPIIFRDLKPTNVMVTPDGHVFLIDFGIARFFTEGKATDTVFLGSPGYASPEQHGTAQTSPRSDIYSLGATLHCCLTGRDPYHAKDRFAFPPARQLNPQVPLELDRLLQRMLARNEQDRPPSAVEVQQELARIRQHAIDDTRAISPALQPAATPNVGSPPALAATQYAQPVPSSNKRSSTIPPTRTVASPTPNYSGRAPALPSTAANGPLFARIWTRPFSIIFGLLLLLTVGGSILVLNTIVDSVHGVEAGLSILLLLVAAVASTMTRGAFPKSVLILTSLAAFVAGLAFALQALGLLMFVSLNPLFTIGLVGAAIFSLIWLTRPFTMVDRIILCTFFGIAAICGLIQYFINTDFNLSKHLLILISLITLILGVLIAAQMERVRAGARGA